MAVFSPIQYRTMQDVYEWKRIVIEINFLPVCTYLQL